MIQVLSWKDKTTNTDILSCYLNKIVWLEISAVFSNLAQLGGNILDLLMFSIHAHYNRGFQRAKIKHYIYKKYLSSVST